MSYAFTVRKVDGVLEVVGDPAANPHVPEGATFVINGHVPSAGTSSVGSIQLTVTATKDGASTFLGQASGSYNTQT